MKKRIIALFIVLCMACSITACGEAAGEQTNEVVTESMETLTEDVQDVTEPVVTEPVENADAEKEATDKEDTENTADMPSEEVQNDADAPVMGQVARVSIDGIEYNLSEDIQAVVGAMVKDGFTVSNFDMKKYDENSKYGEKLSLTENYTAVAAEFNQSQRLFSVLQGNYQEYLNEHGSLIEKMYMFYKMEENKVVSGLDIATVDDMDKLIEKMKFLKAGTIPNFRFGSVGCRAVIVDGKVLETSVYEGKLEELKKDNCNVMGGILGKYFPHMNALMLSVLAGDAFRTVFSYEELEQVSSGYNLPLEEELLINFALEDAYTQLENGQIESFVYVGFGTDEAEARIDMFYREFFFEKDYDQSKFFNQ